MMSFFIADLDGCFSNDINRKDYIPDWDKYHARCMNDDIANESLLRGLCHFMTPIFCTGRTDEWMLETQTWFHRHEIPFQKENLLMRPAGDYRKSPEMKKILLDNWMFNNIVMTDEIKVAFDDRLDILEMYKDIYPSIRCVHVCAQKGVLGVI